MKTKDTVETKIQTAEVTIAKAKLRSLRPMPSLMARRSFKPKTIVAHMIVKHDESAKSN